MDAKQVLVIAATMLAAMGTPAFAQQAREPYVRVAEIEIDPAQLDAYTVAVKEQIEAAIGLEAGVLALYSVADKDNPAHVFVFEMYADLDAYKAHLETPHFKKYKFATQDMVKSLKLRERYPSFWAASPGEQREPGPPVCRDISLAESESTGASGIGWRIATDFRKWEMMSLFRIDFRPLMKCTMTRVLVLFIGLGVSCVDSRAEEIRGLVTIGMKRAFEQVIPGFETSPSRSLDIQFASTPEIAERLQKGEAVEFIIVARGTLDHLIDSKLVAEGDYAILGGSSIAVAVPAGHPKPDISTPEALKSALLAAKAIAYTNPTSGGPSGIHFETVLRRLGIGEQVRLKTKFPPAGGFVGEILRKGDADIGIQQATELSGFEGVEVIGRLPSEFQVVTEYAAAVPLTANHPEAGKTLLQFMRSSEASAAMKARGLDPK
jgi:molybdate transport system substrate-binding protein